MGDFKEVNLMEKRVAKLREQLKLHNHDGILITSQSNRRYITGFTGSAGFALITQDKAVLVTDFRYIDQAKTQAAFFEIIQHQGPIMDTVKEQLNAFGVKTLAFEQDVVTFAQYSSWKELLDNVNLVPTSQFVEKLRLIKDEEEVTLIQKAAEIADQAFSYILGVIKPGMTEIEVAMKLEYKMRELGASGPSFDTIVASGYRSALPHGVASEKVIEKGDFVTMDFGAIYKGYVSDITRTIVIGEASEKQKEIYNIVLEAQLKGVDNIKAGLTGKEADALTRDLITQYGYCDYFGHGTGHGIGLDVHEGPGVSFKSDTVLEPGMVVTVEPGIYLTNFGGVRIEDDVLITEDGNQILTKSPKELIEI